MLRDRRSSRVRLAMPPEDVVVEAVAAAEAEGVHVKDDDESD